MTTVDDPPTHRAAPRGAEPSVDDARAAAMLRLIGRVAADAADITDVAELLKRTVSDVAEVAGCAVGFAYQAESDENLAHVETCWRLSGLDESAVRALRDASERASFSAGIGLPGQAFDRSEPLWVADLKSAPNFPRRAEALAAGLTSAFAFPALVGRRVVAVLEFFWVDAREVDRLLLDACAAIGQTIGQVVERIEAHRGQWELQTEAQLILDNAGDAFVAIDGDGDVIAWNREAERLFGYTASEAIGRQMTELIVPEEYQEAHREGIAHFKAAGRGRIPGQYVELEALRKSGEKFPIEMAFWGMLRGDRWHFFSFGRDITERKRREAALAYSAAHDNLTGLPNRAATLAHLTDVLRDRPADGPTVAVLFMDLDRFKIIREQLGHRAIDQLLREVAARIVAVAGEARWVARVGDDEFAIVCDDIPDESAAAAIAQAVLEALVDPIELRDDQVVIGASIGIVLAREMSDTAEDLLRDASAGIAAERSRARGRIEVFDGRSRRHIRGRLAIERELAASVAGGQLRLHYQPIVDVADGRICGVEALVRWQHPTRGLLPPAKFIELAEDSGLIVPIGSWVLDEACRQAELWQRGGLDGIAVAVNLSARQFAQSGLVDTVARAVDDAKLDLSRSRLVLEVTETMVMTDPDAAARTLDRLHDAGLGVSIDDFGTGYSSLAYLKSFPVDTVKIDRSFVTHMDTDANDRAIVTAVTQLGHALDLRVLAEGVETADQAGCLVDLGCDLAQGYHFGRPVPADEITELLRAQAERGYPPFLGCSRSGHSDRA